MNLQDLKKIKEKFDNIHKNKYFSFIAPNSLGDWSKIVNINSIFATKKQILALSDL